MTRAATGLVLLLTARAALAQSSDEPRVTAYLADTSRVESWSFFEPRAGGGDPTSTFFGNRATLDVAVDSRRLYAEAAVQYSQLLGLPSRAIGPGALGNGALYYVSAEAREAFQVYISKMMLRLKGIAPGASISLGRMGYSSGEEASSGNRAMDDLVKRRIGSRLIGEFESSVFQRAFDGGRVDVDGRSWAANASLLFPTQGGYEESANPTISSLKLLTAAFTVKPALLGHQQLQVFAYYYRDHRAVVARPDNQPPPPAKVDVSIMTLGASDAIIAPVIGGEIDSVVWGGWQRGDWYGDDHAAYSVAVEGGYHLLRARGRPWLRGGYVFASGDGSARDGKHQTFFQMLPSIDRYVRSAMYALMNVRDAFAQVSFEPHKRLRIASELHRVSLANPADRWYYGSGATSRTAPFFGFATRSSTGVNGLATIAEANADISLTPMWSINGYIGAARGGEVVRRQFAGDRLVFFSFENVIRWGR